MRRAGITAVILVLAAVVVWALWTKNQERAAPAHAPEPPGAGAADKAPVIQPLPELGSPATEARVAPPAPAPGAPGAPGSPAVPAAELRPVEGLHIVPVTETQPEPTIGSADAKGEYRLQAQFTPWGGGIIEVLASQYSTRVAEHEPYPLQGRLLLSEQVVDGQTISSYRYPMAASTVMVNGQSVPIAYARWQVVPEQTNAQQATFTLTLADGGDQPVLRLTRAWRIEPGSYDLQLDQRIENLSSQPLNVTFSQFGPGEMRYEPSYLGDRRLVVVGYLQPYRTDATRKYLTTEGLRLNRTDLVAERGGAIWPAEDTEPGQDMAWVATTNRYFAAALHAVVGEETSAIVPLEYQFPTLRHEVWGAAKNETQLLLLDTAPMPLAPAGSAQSARVLRTELFAGPLEPAVLKADDRYIALKLGDLIVYNLGGICAFCTFAWLAEFLLAFLRAIEFLVQDWGVAIIVLVAVVRLLLHPLTVRSQVNMMKMGKQMQSLAPEIERLKAKFGDNAQKLQQETWKLYKEKGVNPAAMGLGCIPMLLQTPIWFALYAVLYYAIELRHSPAFYGVFQQISGGAWPFLADLSTPDRFLPLGDWAFTLPWFGYRFDAINILPILMAGVFFIQQKYMMAASATMTDQQRQQQQIMKWMVLLFPVFLYPAPSGLTLYILTSTTVGIIESRRVRQRVKGLEDRGELFGPAGGKKGPKPGGLFDRLSKAAEARMSQVREAAERQQQQGKGRDGGKGKNRRR